MSSSPTMPTHWLKTVQMVMTPVPGAVKTAVVLMRVNPVAPSPSDWLTK
ncbi:MAG: hypothetical protein EP323_00955 [Gammaproteobacteria bacterium]|nr:MAG: hypothetical protein EP323_00955 [Gammaproteobacteria bacterium]